jgi:RNA polymerase sigma factor (sigma-70 family)
MTTAYLDNFNFVVEDYFYDVKIFKENPLKHIALVNNIAKSFLGRGMEYEDLVGYGFVGLLIACQKYDLSYNCKFSTYGTYWIRNYIQRALIKDSCSVPVLGDVLDNSQKEGWDQKEWQELIRCELFRLNCLERRILYLSFYENYSDTKISFTMGIRMKEVRRLKQNALDKMRDSLEK